MTRPNVDWVIEHSDSIFVPVIKARRALGQEPVDVEIHDAGDVVIAKVNYTDPGLVIFLRVRP